MAVMKLEAGTFVPGLGIVQLPKYINYNETLNAWVISRRPQIKASRYTFPVRDYANVAYAMKAAIRELERSSPELRSKRRLNSHERCDKLVTTDVVGVMYHYYVSPKVKHGLHNFHVHNPLTNKRHTVYIGTDNTYLENWDRTFSNARKLREQFEREYNIDCYWKGLEIQPFEESA